MIDGISAITLATHDMRRAVRFYRMLGFAMLYGGEDEGFTSFKVGRNLVNLIAQPAARQRSWWGRVIFYHSDVDGLYARMVAAGCRIETPPRDAEWGERFFHITDPDGHELSFAWPLKRKTRMLKKSAILSSGGSYKGSEEARPRGARICPYGT
jgi:uncharacterized glyoxalase superfamily protein PhnB